MEQLLRWYLTVISRLYFIMSHRKVVTALEKQSKKLWHTTNIYMYPSVYEYAEKLVSKFPGNLKVKVTAMDVIFYQWQFFKTYGITICLCILVVILCLPGILLLFHLIHAFHINLALQKHLNTSWNMISF